MACFVLVHGMFHGRWCWDRLIPALQAAGHEAIAEDLAGCGKDRTSPVDCTLDRWAADVAALIRTRQEPVILVGHSRGGLVASAAAELAADHIAAIVYLAAVMLPDGFAMSMFPQMLAEEGIPAQDGPLRLSDDGLTVQPVDPDLWFHRGYSEEDRAWSAARLAPEPSAPLTAPLALSPQRYGRIPRIFVETTGDRIFPVASQRAMIRRSPPDDVITLHTDHMPIVTHVQDVVRVLDHVAKARNASR